MSRKIPDRWVIYKPFGSKNLGRILGTRFVAFKVPLKEGLCAQLPLNLRFTPELLLESIKNLGLIIDLTNTNRYYDAQSEFISRGVKYEKIFCEGKVVPSTKVVQSFFRIIDNYIARFPENDNLIGVHCTHGINRTGYLLCSYMIQRMGFAPSTAILEFNNARECPIERENYIMALHQNYQRDPTMDRNQEQPQQPGPLLWRQENRSSNLISINCHRVDPINDDQYQNRNRCISNDGRDFSGGYDSHPPPAMAPPHINYHRHLETIPSPIDSNWRYPRQLPPPHLYRNSPYQRPATSPHNQNGNYMYLEPAPTPHNRNGPYHVPATTPHYRFSSNQVLAPVPTGSRRQNNDQPSSHNNVNSNGVYNRQKYVWRKE